MFDIGWTELLVVGVVALIVVGPKDLPKMFRTLGQFTAKARNMAREFQRAMDAAADETGVKDVANDLRKATSAQEMGLDELRDLNRPEKWVPKGKRSSGDGKVAATDPSAGPAKDPSSDPDGEAAADNELDVVAREMDQLRAERAEARARPSGTPPEPSRPSSDPKTTPDGASQTSARSTEGSGS